MDVKVGSGAFLPARADARALARTLAALGKRLGLPVRALLTDMEQPLGRAIGNAAEVREAIDVLRGGGPADTRALTVRLGAEMLVAGGAARDVRDGARRIEDAIASGAGLDRFRLGVGLQGGDERAIDDPSLLPRATHARTLRAPRRGIVGRVDAGLLGRAATLFGAGRLRKEDRYLPARRYAARQAGHLRRSRRPAVHGRIRRRRARARGEPVHRAGVHDRQQAPEPPPAGARVARLKDASDGTNCSARWEHWNCSPSPREAGRGRGEGPLSLRRRSPHPPAFGRRPPPLSRGEVRFALELRPWRSP